MPPRRPHFSPQEIDGQLQHIYLSTDFLGSQTESLEHLGPVIRNVQASRQHDTYLRHLESFITSKEEEIEQICKANYQDFISSTDGILKIRKGTVSLRRKIGELNEDIQEKGGQVAAKKKELLDARRVASNVDSTIVTLQACLRILDLYAKIGQLISNQDYFSALRNLDDLQNYHLKPLLHLPFANFILTKIPATCQQIRTEITKQFKSWLFEARRESRRVGALGLSTMENRIRRWKSRLSKESSTNKPQLRHAQIGGPVEVSIWERYENDPFDPKSVNINFGPLYSCIHIYDTLGARQELQNSYQQDRRAQSQLLLSQAATHEILANLEPLFEEIVGFFIIEAHVFRTTGTFRSEAQVNQLWEEVCEKAIQIIKEPLSNCHDLDLLVRVKNQLVLFTHSLQNFDYNVSPLSDLLAQVAEQYLNVLLSNAQTDLEQVIMEDDNQAMVASTAEELEKVFNVVWLPEEGPWSREEIEYQPPPLALPFSQMYPMCCIDIRHIYDEYISFCEDIHVKPQAKIYECLIQALNTLPTKNISDVIYGRARNTSNLSQLAQMIVNLLFLQVALENLGQDLSSRTKTQVYFDAQDSIKNCIAAIEGCIVESVSQKLDNFLEQASYDWTTSKEPSMPIKDPKTNEYQVPSSASDYLVDLSGYLTLVVNSILIQLPQQTRNEIHQGVLRHVADRLLSFLVDPLPNAVSEQALAHFCLDINYLRGQSSLVDATTEEDAFEEIHQIIDLILSDSYQDYLDSDLRQMAFPAIRPKPLQLTLVKLITNWNSMNFNSPNLSSKRKRNAEELLKAISK